MWLAGQIISYNFSLWAPSLDAIGGHAHREFLEL